MGIGERRAVRDTDVMSGNVKLALSHVVPDLVLKVLRGQDPLHLLGDGTQVRCYTYGGDLARGIRLAMESDAAVNEDFNLSTPVSTTVLELAELIWRKVHGADRPFAWVSDPPFDHDVQHRVPDVRKARDVLGFEADDEPLGDARRGDPVDPRRGRGRGDLSAVTDPPTPAAPTGTPQLTAVMPVWNEGERVVPTIRAFAAAVRTPYELLVVHDMPEDTTVPVVERLARRDPGPAGAPQHAGPRRAQRDEGGDGRRPGPVRARDDGRRLRRVRRRGPDGGAGARRGGRRGREPLHARRAPGRRARA